MACGPGEREGEDGMSDPDRPAGLREDGETWRCVGCHDTTAPMGMCQKCGVFGTRQVTGLEPEDGYVMGFAAARAIVESALSRASYAGHGRILMTPETLDRLDALAEKATRGPWESWIGDGGAGIYIPTAAPRGEEER